MTHILLPWKHVCAQVSFFLLCIISPGFNRPVPKTPRTFILYIYLCCWYTLVLFTVCRRIMIYNLKKKGILSYFHFFPSFHFFISPMSFHVSFLPCVLPFYLPHVFPSVIVFCTSCLPSLILPFIFLHLFSHYLPLCFLLPCFLSSLFLFVFLPYIFHSFNHLIFSCIHTFLIFFHLSFDFLYFLILLFLLYTFFSVIHSVL